MTSRQIRLTDRVTVRVEAPDDTLIAEILGAIVVSARLGDGLFSITDDHRPLQPGESLGATGTALAVEPRSEVKQRLRVPGNSSLTIGSASLRFEETAAPSGARDAIDIKIVNTDGPQSKPPSGRTLEDRDLEPWTPGTLYCIGCGRRVSASEDLCRECGTKVSGGRAVESVDCLSYQNLAIPMICCCCLKPREVIKEHKALASMQGNVKTYLLVSMPWCRTCRRRNWWMNAMLRVFLVLGIAGGIYAGILLDDAEFNGWICFFGGLAAGIVIFVLGAGVMGKIGPFNEPGHVSGCEGFIGAGPNPRGTTQYQLAFGNRQFARQWRALNS